MPVGGEPRGHLRERVPRVQAGRREEAGQHGVAGDEQGEAVAAGGAPDEVPEALLGPLAAQPAQPPGLVQFRDEGAPRDPGQPTRQLPPEVRQDGRGAVCRRAVRRPAAHRAVDRRAVLRECVPEPPRRRLDERCDDRPEAAEPGVGPVGDHHVTRRRGDGLPGEDRPAGFAGSAAPDDARKPPRLPGRTPEGCGGGGAGRDGRAGGGGGGGRGHDGDSRGGTTGRPSVDQILLRHRSAPPRSRAGPGRAARVHRGGGAGAGAWGSRPHLSRPGAQTSVTRRSGARIGGFSPAARSRAGA